MSLDRPHTLDPNRLSLGIKLFLALLFLVVVIVTHGGSFHGEFVFDDTGSIVENTSIRSLTSLSKVLTDGEYTTVAGRPLLNLSLALNYALGGVRVEGYHAINYLIHAANVFLLFSLLRRGFAQFPKTRAAAFPLALVTSLLWSVHPLTINAISYVSQRAESITSGFYLIVLWGFLKGVQTTQRRWFVISVLAAWLGGLTKEIIATVPLTTIALDVLLISQDWRTAVRKHWRVYLLLMTSWLPLGVCMWASKGREGTVGFGMGVTLQEHVQTQVWALARYLRLAIWPQPLVFDFGDRFVVTDSSQVIAAVVVVAAFAALVLWLLVRRSPLAILGVVPTFLLAPTLVIPIATQTVAEHRMYLASASLTAAVVVGIYLLLLRMPRFSAVSTARQSATLGAVLLPAGVMLFLATALHTQNFASNESLWGDTVEKQPANQRAVFSLAAAKFNAKNDDEGAERLCDRAIGLPGRYVANAYHLRGRIYERRGETQQALDNFTQAITLHPNGKYVVVAAYEHRAQVYAQQREFQKALDDFSQAIALRPKAVKYYLQRAITLRDAERYDEALRDLDKATEIEPDNSSNDIVRASVEVAQGNLAAALQSFDRLLKREPNHVGARRRRAWVYAQLNRWDEAMREIRLLQAEGQRVDSKLVEQVQQNLASRAP